MPTDRGYAQLQFASRPSDNGLPEADETAGNEAAKTATLAAPAISVTRAQQKRGPYSRASLATGRKPPHNFRSEQ